MSNSEFDFRFLRIKKTILHNIQNKQLADFIDDEN